MGRRGNPYDNAKAESFMKTLKVEEVYLLEYDTRVYIWRICAVGNARRGGGISHVVPEPAGAEAQTVSYRVDQRELPCYRARIADD